ncbi:MAG: HAMP domain-containing sensor histidine kinase [Candidatus Peribacteraceae bacterium]|nr:HAMP domain-containing sensor histidine kinase [Candidatus Peribacteraceae bacterium]
MYPFRFIRAHYQTISTIAAAGFLLVVVLFLGILFYTRGRSAMELRLKDRLQTVATISAQLFTGEELDRIRTEEDMQKLQFVSIAHKLKDVLDADPNINSVYLLRQTEDPLILRFIVDADSLKSFAELDEDGSGALDASEVVPVPGEPYDVTDIPKLQGEAFLRPTTDDAVTMDQWGFAISGYAPIRRADKSVAGIIGIDMSADRYYELATSIFSPVALTLFLLLAALLSSLVYMMLSNRRIAALMQLENERTSLLQLIMHQIGTPLTAFKWYEEDLQETAGKDTCDPEEVRAHGRNVQEAIEILQNIFEGLVQADQIRHSSQSYKRGRTTLRSILDDVTKIEQADLARRSQTLAVDITEKIFVEVDRNVIVGVLRELLRNAITFSPEKSAIALRAHCKGCWAVVEVEDHGCGIPPEDLNRIFGKFVRGSNAARYKPTGNGLGLFVVKEIIDKIGGKVHIRSIEGKGTTVEVWLPVE